MNKTSFAIGQKIRVNFWVDRRESGWRHGTVLGNPVDCYGVFAQRVMWEDGGYESLMANSLFEEVEPSPGTTATNPQSNPA